MKRKYYRLNGSQTVAMYERSLSFHKELINIPFCFQFRKKLDHELIRQIFNMEIERFDSLRIRLARKKGKLVQYFTEPYQDNNIEEIDFTGKSEEFQRTEIVRLARLPLNLMKGECYRFVIFTNIQGNTGFLIVVSHTNLDTTGIFTLLQDMIGIYRHMTEGTEMPKGPLSFESSLEKDLYRFYDEKRRRDSSDYITDTVKNQGEPYFTALSGSGYLESFRKKKRNNSLRYTNLLLLKNETNQFRGGMSTELTEKIMGFCREHRCSPHIFFKLLFWAVLYKLNSQAEKIAWLVICDGRASITDRMCAGTKAQAMIEYPDLSHSVSFEDGIGIMLELQSKIFKYFGNEESKIVLNIQKTVHTGYLSIWYPFITSYVPVLYTPDPGWELDFEWISAGRFALPAYIALSHNMADMSFDFQYDFQKKISGVGDVEKFHNLVVKAAGYVLENKDITLGDLADRI